MTQPFLVAAFYKFVALDDLETRRKNLQILCEENQIRGTTLLAYGGINATICGDENALRRVLDVLKSDTRFADLVVKISMHDAAPFARLKVKIKPEIVTLGQPGIDPTQRLGTYVAPENWNELISNPEFLVLDTRNQSEVEIGSFAGATEPQTRSFRQFFNFVEAKLQGEKQQKSPCFAPAAFAAKKRQRICWPRVSRASIISKAVFCGI